MSSMESAGRIGIRSRRPKTVLAALATVATLMATFTGSAVLSAPARADGPISIEGEDATTTNFPQVITDSQASGGEYLRVFTGDEPADGSYFASYTVPAPAAGLYTFTADMTPSGASWSSPVSITVNGEQHPTTPTYKNTSIPEIRTSALGAVWLTEGDNTVTFTVGGHRADDQRYLTFIDRIRFEATTFQVAAIDSAAPLDMFEDGAEVALDVRLNARPQGTASVDYRVLDYSDAEVTTGAVPVPETSDKASVPLGELPIGHYRIVASVAGGAEFTHEFAVVLPRTERPDVSDSPFGVDAIGSWSIPADRQQEVADALGLSGIAWMRGRTSWNDATNPSSGVFDFGREQAMGDFYQKVDAQGINILAAYHTAPDWTKTHTGDVMPGDLLAAYQYALAASTNYSAVDAWEIWNEADAPGSNPFSSGNESADQYAAMMKAASIGFNDAPNSPIIADAGTAGQRKPYTDLMARNDVFSYADVHAFHLYATDDGSELPSPWGGIPPHLDLVDTYGTETTQRWITEGGVKFQVPTPQPMTSQQQRAQARGFVADTLTALSQGVDRVFPFSLPALNEGSTFFGLLTRDWAPNAAFTAQATMTAALGEADFAGTIPGLPEGVIGFAFDDGADQVITLWSENATDVTVDLDATSVTRTSIVGVSDELTSTDGRYALTAQADPVYLRIHDGRVVTAETTPTVGPTQSTLSFTPAQRVVVAPHFSDAARADSKAQGYRISGDQANDLEVELYNLNDVEMTGTVHATADNDWQIAVGQPQVTIPPMSSVVVPVQISAGADTVMGVRGDVRIGATFNGQEASTSVAEIVGSSASAASNHVLTENDVQALRVTYTNTTDAPTRLNVIKATFGDDEVTVPTRGATVQPGQSLPIDVPIPVTASGSTDYRVTFVAPRTSVPDLAGTVTIPEADDVASAVPVEQLDGAPPVASIGEGPGSSADVTLAWSPDSMIVDVVVADDVHQQPFTGQKIWQGDSIQVALAPGFPGETISAGAEYGAALTPEGAEAAVFRNIDGSPGDTTAASADVTRDDGAGVTHYRLAIPWTELGPIAADQRLLSLSVLVNDDDGGGRSFIGWGGGISNAKDSSEYNPVTLAN